MGLSLPWLDKLLTCSYQDRHPILLTQISFHDLGQNDGATLRKRSNINFRRPAMEAFESNHSLPTAISRHFREDKSSDGFHLAMGLGKPFPQQLPDAEAFVVEFDGQGDPWKPYNWRLWTKYVLAIAISQNLTDSSLQALHFLDRLLRYFRRILRQCAICRRHCSS